VPFLPFLTAMLVGALPVPVTPRTAPTFNGGVYSIAHRGSTVYVGGAFTTATSGGKTVKRLRLAAFDSRTGRLLDWAPPADGTVRALAATTDSVYAAGDFHAVGGKGRDSLARLHPSTGAVNSFSHDVSGTAYALTTGNNRLYLGGSFTSVDGERRSNLAAFALDTGRLDTRWRPAADDTVHTLAIAGAKVFLGGGFHAVNGVKGTLRLAAVNGASGTVDPVFRPRVPAEVRSIALDPAGVHVATAGVGGRAISYAYTGALRWQRVFDGDAAAIASAGGILYIGGHFDSICLTERNGAKGGCVDGSQPRLKLAALTSTGTLTSWAPKANGVIGVRVLTVHHGTVEAGGDFTMIDGRDRRRFAAF
jgi:outer membrane protein assembly factor BamB